MIARLRRLGAFWYDFVIGDDWTVALGAVAALAATYLIADISSVATWPIPVAAVALLLPYSLQRATRRRPPS